MLHLELGIICKNTILISKMITTLKHHLIHEFKTYNSILNKKICPDLTNIVMVQYIQLAFKPIIQFHIAILTDEILTLFNDF